MIHEEVVNLGERGTICGIFTPTPANALRNNPCVIFLNAGLIHKIGPNRINKNLAENYAENGFASFRMDFSGLGDSEFSNEKVSKANEQIMEVKMAMNWLQKNKGIDTFLLSGICSGAKAAWDVSLDDPRVIGLCLIDGIYLEDSQKKEVGWKADQQLKVRYYKKHMFSASRWMKLLTAKSQVLRWRNISIGMQFIAAALKKYVRKLPKKISNRQVAQPPAPGWANSFVLWDNLFKRNVHVLMIFSEGSVAIDIYNVTFAQRLSKYQKSALLQITLVKDVDHTFTPGWSQKYLTDLTTTWLKKEFK